MPICGVGDGNEVCTDGGGTTTCQHNHDGDAKHDNQTNGGVPKACHQTNLLHKSTNQSMLHGIVGYTLLLYTPVPHNTGKT